MWRTVEPRAALLIPGRFPACHRHAAPSAHSLPPLLLPLPLPVATKRRRSVGPRRQARLWWGRAAQWGAVPCPPSPASLQEPHTRRMSIVLETQHNSTDHQPLHSARMCEVRFFFSTLSSSSCTVTARNTSSSATESNAQMVSPSAQTHTHTHMHTPTKAPTMNPGRTRVTETPVAHTHAAALQGGKQRTNLTVRRGRDGKAQAAGRVGLQQRR